MLDPVVTFFVYIAVIAGILTAVAVVADLWTAKVERQLRDQARADARVERMDGEVTSQDAWL